MRRKVGRFLFAVCWLLAGWRAIFAAPAAAAGGNQTAAAPVIGKAGTFPNETIQVGKLTRVYRLVVPDSVDLSKPAPLLFAFHGMGEDSKDHMPGATGLNELAAKYKFIVAYPAASVDHTPIGNLTTWAMTADHAQEDLAFFDALLAKLKSQYRIDPNRIYLTGMSNGGYFAHLVARERPDTIAAVASNSGEIGEIDLFKVNLGRKFPVMIIHGDVDPIFPIATARAMRDLYKAMGHPVVYVEVPGLGHEWAAKANIDEQIWAFFAANPLPGAKK